MKDNLAYLARLRSELKPLYVPPYTDGGHDYFHVEGVELLGPRIRAFLEFDPDEFAAAAWLHNLDRCIALRAPIAERGGLAKYLRFLLQDSPFGEAATNRIVDAVLQHSKRFDGPGDSALLQALRIADKVERFTAVNIMAIPAHRGNEIPLFDPAQPFGYETQADCAYKFYFWKLEWIWMLPSDEARGLIDPEHLWFFTEFLRKLGADISRRTGAENRVEEDIRAALGDYYRTYADPEPQGQIA